jgi:hypothetical protein
MTLYEVFGGMIISGILTFLFSGYFWEWYFKRDYIVIPKRNSYTKESLFKEFEEASADV